MSLLDWTKSETVSEPDRIALSWTSEPNAQGQTTEKNQTLVSTTKSTSTSSYETIVYQDIDGNIKTQDVQVRKEDIKWTTQASVNQEYILTCLKYGRGLPTGGDKERSVTEYEYTVTPEGPILEKETTEVFISLVSFAGQLQGIPYAVSISASQTLFYVPLEGEIIGHRTIVAYEHAKTAEGRDLSRTKTSRWIALGLTSEGKTAFQKRMTEVGSLVAKLPETFPAAIDLELDSHSSLIFQGTEVQVSTGRAPVPAKPSNADLAANEVTNGSNIPSDATPTDVYGNNRGWTQFIPSNVDWRTLRGDSNGDGIPDWADYVPSGQDWKDYNTSDTDYSNPDAQASNEKSITGRVIFDGQNYDDSNPTVTATYQMPFAPDDYFYYDANGIRRLHRSGAKAAAIKFGQTEAALDIGHAYGQNIVTNFANTPTLDLSPVYVRLAGIEGAFLLDGASYAWGPEGMVVSSDLMLVGVTGYDGTSAPATSWLRLPVAPAGIGPAGATTTEASPVKANSIAIPGGFDIRSPGAVLAALPTNGADVFREWRSNAPVVPPTLVLETEVIATGPALTTREFGYGLTLETDVAAIASGPAVDFAWVTLVSPPAAAITVAALAPTVSTGAAVKVPAAAVTVEALAPVVSSGASVQPPAAGLTLEGLAPELVGRPKTIVNVPAAEITVAALAPVVSSGVSVLVPAAEITVAGLAPSVLTTVNPIPALSPVLWYDFADESTVTVSSSQITQITDKGSRGWTLTKSATGPGYVTGINGRKCVDWGSSAHNNYLRNTSTTSTSIGEIYVVLDASYGSTFPTYNGLVTAATTGWNVVGLSGNTGFYADGENSFTGVYLNGSTTNSYSSGILTTINSPALLRIKNTNDTAKTSTTGFQIGTDRNLGLSRGWYGLIGEVVVFTAPLSATDRAAVKSYLASKWGITL